MRVLLLPYPRATVYKTQVSDCWPSECGVRVLLATVSKSYSMQETGVVYCCRLVSTDVNDSVSTRVRSMWRGQRGLMTKRMCLMKWKGTDDDGDVVGDVPIGL